jgi:hypothetical protein
MLRGLMLVQFERNVRLAFAAPQHFLMKFFLLGSVDTMPADQSRSLLDGCIRFGFTFLAMFSVQSCADWALHSKVNL